MSDLVVIETDVAVDFVVIGGESGPRGFKGGKGDKGDKGDPGNVADAPVVSVNDKIGVVVLDAADVGADAAGAAAAVAANLVTETARAEAAEAALAEELSDLDLSGPAGAALIEAKAYTDDLAAMLGTAATHPATDFDPAGAAAAAQAASQPLDSDLTAIAALSTTTFGRALLALADAAAGRTAFGLGTSSTHDAGDFDVAGAAAAAQAAAEAASQPLDSDLTAIAALSTTTFGRALLALADAAAGRTAFGLGTASTHPATDFDAAGAAAAAQAASQPLDSDLTAIAALSTTTFGRALLALADAAAGRTALGLGTASTHPSTDFDAAGAAAAAQAASQPLDGDLTAIAGVTTTSFGRGFLALADAAAARTYIGAAASGASAVPYVVAGSDASVAIQAAADLVSSGTGADDHTKLAALFAVAGTRPMRAYGTFAPNAAIAISAVDDVDLGGDFTILTPDSTYPTPAVQIAGSRTALTTTWTDSSVAQGINVLNFSGTAPSLVAGDRVAFTTDQGWGSRPGENFAGEWLEVESVGASSVVFKTPFRHAYTPSASSAIKVYKYNLIKRCRIDGVRIIGPGGPGNAITTSTNRERMFVVAYADRPEITHCYVEGPYAREGIATYECFFPTGLDIEIKDVNDLAGSSGTYEAYGLRAMGCEGGLFDRIVGQGCRHIIDVNGGQSAYGLTAGTFRPLSHGFELGTIKATKTWAAAVGDHPGAVDTFFRDITGYGCSGVVFARGLHPKFGKVRMYGGHHLNGPYGSSQGNDHCITLGEQQRDGSNAADNTTRDGWCGTDVEILDVEHDMTGNGDTLGSTSHTVHAVHPLVRARIDLGAGVCKPTGNGVNAVGMFNHDNEITGVVDLTASFSGGGRAVLLAPAATSPTVSTGQYSSDNRIDVTAILPRNTPVVIAGSADTAARSERNKVHLKVHGLGSGLSSTDPAILFDKSPNTSVGGFHGFTIVRELDLADFASGTAVALGANSTVASAIWYYGVSTFNDGTVSESGPFLFWQHPNPVSIPSGVWTPIPWNNPVVDNTGATPGLQTLTARIAAGSDGVALPTGTVHLNAMPGGAPTSGFVVITGPGQQLLSGATTTVASPGVINKNAHGLVSGQKILFSGLSSTTGIANGTVYYVKSPTTNAFNVSATIVGGVPGTAINFGGTTDTVGVWAATDTVMGYTGISGNDLTGCNTSSATIPHTGIAVGTLHIGMIVTWANCRFAPNTPYLWAMTAQLDFSASDTGIRMVRFRDGTTPFFLAVTSEQRVATASDAQHVTFTSQPGFFKGFNFGFVEVYQDSGVTLNLQQNGIESPLLMMFEAAGT